MNDQRPRTTPEPSLFSVIRMGLSDLADSATRDATGRTHGLAAEMASINPAHDGALSALAEVQAAIDGYIEAVIAHEDVNAAYDEGMGLWPDHILRAKKAEQEAYERLYALSARGREIQEALNG